MNRMTTAEVLAALGAADVFEIVTEKTIEMLPGAPSRTMLKVSRYAIETGQVLAEHLSKAPEASWWSYTSDSKLVCKRNSDTRYVLSGLMKSDTADYRGTSDFYPIDANGQADRSRPYSKKSLGRWLPAQEPFTAEYLTLPLAGIVSLVPLDLSPITIPKTDPLSVTSTSRPSLSALLAQKKILDDAIAAAQITEAEEKNADWITLAQSA